MVRVSFKNVVFSAEKPEFSAETIIVTVEGHSLFDVKGRDIVCAAVSALAQTLVLSLSRAVSIKQDVKQEQGFLRSAIEVRGLNEDQVLQLRTLVQAFYIGISEIDKNYPDTIRIKW